MQTADLPAQLRRIEQKLDEVLKLLKATPGVPNGEFKPKTVTDSELDGKYGNPKVRTMPRDWRGPDYTGWKFSDCPPDFLELHASMLDAFARKQAADPVQAKFADWSAKDAARARAWAVRLRGAQARPSEAADWNEPDGTSR